MEGWAPLSKRIARRINAFAASRSDARLPSERELSSVLGVSRSSVREALALLVAAGKLRTWPGRGSFWVTVSAATPQSPDANTWYNEENGKEVDGPKIYLPSEIFQLRYQIEGQSCRLAAKRITEEEIEQLETNMRTFKSQTRAMDLEARAKTDFDFHQLIVEFSEIQLFVDLHLALRGLFIKAVQINSSQYCSTWQPVAEHENIIEALKRRDPDEALYFMQSHVARSASRLSIAGL